MAAKIDEALQSKTARTCQQIGHLLTSCSLDRATEMVLVQIFAGYEKNFLRELNRVVPGWEPGRMLEMPNPVPRPRGRPVALRNYRIRFVNKAARQHANRLAQELTNVPKPTKGLTNGRP
jgi:hypothetical protein